jgi:arylsulfatase A-like enzyme
LVNSLPGRANFITGELPIRTGLTTVGQAGADVGMPAQAVTLATVLKSLGYETGQFGKNHLGDLNKYLPCVHGFDEFFGYLPQQEHGSWFRARIANAVRTTQLTVSELGPGILARVETDVAISATKLPFPQPIRFRAGTVQPPAESLQPGRHGRHRFAVDSCRDVQALTLIRIMARFLKRSR